MHSTIALLEGIFYFIFYFFCLYVLIKIECKIFYSLLFIARFVSLSLSYFYVIQSKGLFAACSSIPFSVFYLIVRKSTVSALLVSENLAKMRGKI